MKCRLLFLVSAACVVIPMHALPPSDRSGTPEIELADIEMGNMTPVTSQQPPLSNEIEEIGEETPSDTASFVSASPSSCHQRPHHEPILITPDLHLRSPQETQSLLTQLNVVLPTVPPPTTSAFKKWVQRMHFKGAQLKPILTQCGVEWFLIVSLGTLALTGAGGLFGMGFTDDRRRYSACLYEPPSTYWRDDPRRCEKFLSGYENHATTLRKGAAFFGAMGAWIGFRLTLMSAMTVFNDLKRWSRWVEPLVGAGVEFTTSMMMVTSLSRFESRIDPAVWFRTGAIFSAMDAGVMLLRLSIMKAMWGDTAAKQMDGAWSGGAFAFIIQAASVGVWSVVIRQVSSQLRDAAGLGAAFGAMHTLLMTIYYFFLLWLAGWRFFGLRSAITASKFFDRYKTPEWQEPPTTFKKHPKLLNNQNRGDSNKFADARITLVDSTNSKVIKERAVHKLVLGLSPVYSKMMEAGDTIRETGVCVEALDAFIDYL